jgi:hypothetical protein
VAQAAYLSGPFGDRAFPFGDRDFQLGMIQLVHAEALEQPILAQKLLQQEYPRAPLSVCARASVRKARNLQYGPIHVVRDDGVVVRAELSFFEELEHVVPRPFTHSLWLCRRRLIGSHLRCSVTCHRQMGRCSPFEVSVEHGKMQLFRYAEVFEALGQSIIQKLLQQKYPRAPECVRARIWG